MKISNEIEEVTDCIICDSDSKQNDPVLEKILGLKNPYRVKLCESCGMRWLSPRPTASVYSEIYSNQDYLSSVESYAELAKIRAPYFRARINRIKKCFSQNNRLNVLELGSATGEFINEALKSGCNATGIELSEESRSIAKKLYNIELINQDISELPNSKFDVIHMNHVFEHLLNPKEVLDECKRTLKKNGLLVIEIPNQVYNDLDKLKKLLGVEKLPKFDAYSLHHTYFFTPETIVQLFKKQGFEVIHMTTFNANRTPLKPFKLYNLALFIYLSLSNYFRKGGNIIEVYAKN